MAISLKLNRSIDTVVQITDYIPVVATVTNLAHIILKALSQNTSLAKSGIYFKELNEKSYFELFLKMIPIIGQIETIRHAIFMNMHVKTASGPFIPQRATANQQIINHLKSQPNATHLMNKLPWFLQTTDFAYLLAKEGFDVGEIYINWAKTQKELILHHPGLYGSSRIHPSLFKDADFLDQYLEKFPLAYEWYLKNIAWTEERFENAFKTLSSTSVINTYLKNHIFKTICELYLSSCGYGILREQTLTSRPVEIIAKYYPLTFKMLPRHTFLTKNFALLACRTNGISLEHMGWAFRNDDQVIKAALEQNPLALCFVPEAKRTENLIRFCIEKNPACWEFAPVEFKNANLDLYIQSIKDYPEAFPKLKSVYKGSISDMIVDQLLPQVESDPEIIFDLSLDFATHPRLLERAIRCSMSQFFQPTDVTRRICAKLEKYLSDTTICAWIRDVNPCVNALSPQRRAAYNYLNATGRVILSDQSDDSLGIIYGRLNPQFMTKAGGPKAIFAQDTYKPSDEGNWEEVFQAILAHKYNHAVQIRYEDYLYERPFFASLNGEGLRQYFAQTKKQLRQIAGYIRKHPEDKSILEWASRGFTACAAGTQSELEQICDHYCQFSGNPPLEYRLGKIIHDLAKSAVEETVRTSYGSDVHYLNSFRYQLDSWFLNTNLQDTFPKAFSQNDTISFFSIFNAKSVLSEIQDTIKSSPSFRELVRKKVQEMIQNEAKDAKLTEGEIVVKSLEVKNIINAIKDLYSSMQEINDVLPRDAYDLCLSKASAAGQETFVKMLYTRALKSFYREKLETILSDKTTDNLYGYSKDKLEKLDAHEGDAKEEKIEELIVTNPQFKCASASFDRFKVLSIELAKLRNYSSDPKDVVLEVIQEQIEADTEGFFGWGARDEIAAYANKIIREQYLDKLKEEVEDNLSEQAFDENGNVTKVTLVKLLKSLEFFTA